MENLEQGPMQVLYQHYKLEDIVTAEHFLTIWIITDCSRKILHDIVT
jgi:hypothetical protein